MDSTKLCIGAVMQPLAELGPQEEEIAVVRHPGGPIRCKRCRTYMNPFMEFVENGDAFNCCICGTRNDCPKWYRSNLDPNNQRRDRTARMELCRGSVEYEVGEEFLLRPIEPPRYLFVIDVTFTAIVTGLVEQSLNAVRYALDDISKRNLDACVGVITYSDKIHFYRFAPDRPDAQMYVVGDVDGPFCPAPMHELLVTASDEKTRYLFDNCLDMIQEVFSPDNATPPPEGQAVLCAAGAAAQAASCCLESGGGKVLLFQSSLCSVGVGKLENRERYALCNSMCSSMW
jgi:protein transport protein SEC24